MARNQGAQKNTRSNKPKVKKNIAVGVAHISSTFNNTIITLTDMSGAAISWSSAGQVGFKGTKKGTPFAAQLGVRAVRPQSAGTRASARGCAGERPRFGSRNRDSRPVRRWALEVSVIRDVTPLPHNGCRAPKKRRV